MQVQVTGRHFEITPAIEGYVREKLERLERHFDKVHDVHVILSVEKLVRSAEGTVHVNGSNLHAEAEHEDMYAALDALADKLDRQVRKHKEKLTNHHREEGHRRKSEYAVAEPE